MASVQETIVLKLDRRRAAKLRRVCRLRRTTIDALVSEMTDRLDNAPRTENEKWLESLGTTLSGKLSKKEIKSDPRLAKYLIQPPRK